MSGDFAEPPPGIGFVRLAVAAPSAAAFAHRLAQLPSDSPLRALAAAHPDGWQTVRAVLGTVIHDDPADDPSQQMGRVAAMFDAAVAISPEASVAVYSLGDAGALKAATDEIVDWLAARHLLGREQRVLDLGCGIGRLEQAIAGRVAAVTGIDVSPAMVAEAARRCADLPNVTIGPSSGLDLADFPDGSFEMVIAVDSFPYVVAAGEAFAARMIGEAARVLAPAGSVVICNYSYEGGPDDHRAALERFGRASGLTLRIAGGQPFQHWDGWVYQLVKAG